MSEQGIKAVVGLGCAFLLGGMCGARALRNECLRWKERFSKTVKRNRELYDRNGKLHRQQYPMDVCPGCGVRLCAHCLKNHAVGCLDDVVLDGTDGLEEVS